MTFVYILLATFFVSLGGLLGVFTLGIKDTILKKWLQILVALSAGAMLGSAFLHLLPEATETIDAKTIFPFLLITFISFFFVEKMLYWRHCHHGHCDVHTFGYMNLLGDSIHNFIDGLIIAGAFVIDTNLGIITTLAVALHEIPQEISDFGVLLYSGFSKQKALLANFAVALTAVLGGVVGYFLTSEFAMLTPYLLIIAAGSFVYIAASDLIPEIRQQNNFHKVILNFLFFLGGIVLMLLVQLFSPHSHGDQHYNEDPSYDDPYETILKDKVKIDEPF